MRSFEYPRAWVARENSARQVRHRLAHLINLVSSIQVSFCREFRRRPGLDRWLQEPVTPESSVPDIFPTVSQTHDIADMTGHCYKLYVVADVLETVLLDLQLVVCGGLHVSSPELALPAASHTDR